MYSIINATVIKQGGNLFLKSDKTYTHDNKILTHPQVVEVSNNSLKFQRYIDIDVLIKAGLYWAEGRQRRPIVPPAR